MTLLKSIILTTVLLVNSINPNVSDEMKLNRKSPTISKKKKALKSTETLIKKVSEKIKELEIIDQPRASNANLQEICTTSQQLEIILSKERYDDYHLTREQRSTKINYLISKLQNIEQTNRIVSDLLQGLLETILIHAIIIQDTMTKISELEIESELLKDYFIYSLNRFYLQDLDLQKTKETIKLFINLLDPNSSKIIQIQIHEQDEIDELHRQKYSILQEKEIIIQDLLSFNIEELQDLEIDPYQWISEQLEISVPEAKELKEKIYAHDGSYDELNEALHLLEREKGVNKFFFKKIYNIIKKHHKKLTRNAYTMQATTEFKAVSNQIEIIEEQIRIREKILNDLYKIIKKIKTEMIELEDKFEKEF